jgi:hypothetical protein
MGTYICTTDPSANYNLVTKIVQVNTTSPKKYCVQPNVGGIHPRSSLISQVVVVFYSLMVMMVFWKSSATVFVGYLRGTWG